MKIFNKQFFILILIFLSIDFVTSRVFFKNLKSWNSDLYKGKPWRIVSEQYHHDLSKYINVIEKWGEKSNNLITNSLNYYVYCHSGTRSVQACQIMKTFGINNVYNLLGGISEWNGPKVKQ